MSRLFLAARLFVNTFRFPFGPAFRFWQPGCFLPPKPTQNLLKSILIPWDGAKRLIPHPKGLRQHHEDAPEYPMMERIQHWGVGRSAEPQTRDKGLREGVFPQFFPLALGIPPHLAS